MEEDKELQRNLRQWYSLKGVLKKKRKEGSLLSKIDSSVNRFFRSWCEGKLICYYDETPDYSMHPKGVIFTTEIIKVIPNYKGKKRHFYLQLKGKGKDLHLKADDPVMAVKWVEALTGLSDFYRGKKIFHWLDDRKDYKSDIDIRLYIMIMMEQEKLRMEEIKRERSFSGILKDKGITEYLEMLDPVLRKTRVMMGKAKIATGRSQELSQGIINPNILWIDVFVFLVCSKSKDEDGVDNKLVEESKLPPWAELDTIYCFKHEEPNDKSEFIKKVHGRQMEMIEYSTDSYQKQSFTITIELKDSLLYFETKYATEASMWITALRSAKRTSEEISRTKNGKLHRNIDPFIDWFRRKQGEKLKQQCEEDFDKFDRLVDVESSEFDTFIEVLTKSQGLYSTTLDALQAYRPFYNMLFKLYLKDYHLNWTDLMADYWNENIENMGTVQILRFLSLLYKQEAIINEYGMSDPRYNNSYNELISTFCFRIFKNVMPLAIQVLKKAQTDTFDDNEICQSHAPTDLFKLIFEIFDSYQYCPHQDVSNGILGLCYKILHNFQKEFKRLVYESDDMDLKIYSALTNSNIKFISCMREFVERVSTETGQDQSLVKSWLSHNQLMKEFGLIANSCFVRIQDLVDDLLSTDMINLPPHKDFLIEDWIEEKFFKFKEIFDRMYKSYTKKLWKFVFDKFTTLFIQYLILSTLQYAPENKDDFVEKIAEQRDIISDVFEAVVSVKDVKEKIKKLDHFIDCLKLPADKVVVSMANLRIIMKGKNFNIKCMKCILRMRHDIIRQEKVTMLRVLEEKSSAIKEKERKNLGRMLKKSLMTDQLVRQYCYKFKQRLEDKRKAKERKSQNRLDNELLNINANEKLQVEQESFGLRGFLGVNEFYCADPLKRDLCLKEIKIFTYSKMHFSFLDDIILWKKKPTAKTIHRKIYLVTIDEIGVKFSNYLWFTKEKVCYVLKCQSEEERRMWTKALVFLRQESLEEVKPLSFQKFSCIDESEEYDELFEADDIDYAYESIEILKKEKKERKKFDMNDIDLDEHFQMEENMDDGIKELSVCELSSSDEEEEEEEEEEQSEESDDGQAEEELPEGGKKPLITKQQKKKLMKAKKKVTKLAKKQYKKEVKKFTGYYEEFKASEGKGNYFERAKDFFGF